MVEKHRRMCRTTESFARPQQAARRQLPLAGRRAAHDGQGFGSGMQKGMQEQLAVSKYTEVDTD